MISVENFHGNIYKNIENAIIEAGISKNELANKLKISNANVSFILMKLKNGRSVNTGTLCKWAEALNVPVTIFFEKMRD